ncbi:hypothetical protein AXF42_Ash017034 [Apostasia shenzhenica]|uniref:Uncharacterized protein n=1 Tax=Apostasia shenzhenica TaxID=1088818 RepID=A0A2I0B7J2_9ASPA|nr:hypothetical protein AXF42_Ash017034 [Apostasia shenzhenica]
MDRSEPTFVPEWYKGTSSSATSSSNSNHYIASSHSEEQKSGVPTRIKLSVNASERDSLRSSSFTDRNLSSFQKSASSNGTVGWAKDVIPSRPYSSLGRSLRDRDKDREKDQDRERHRFLLVDSELSDSSELLNFNRPAEDSLRCSQSMVSGRRADSWYRRPGRDSSNGVPSGGIRSTGVNKKPSFEKEFPSLGAEEKHFGSDVVGVSSPGLTSAIHNLPLNASTIIGGDGWTSALAEVPPISGGNGQAVSSALQTSHALASTALSNSTGLNMAETVAQAPARARVPTQVIDSQKIEDLHRQQVLKLIPMTPKTLGINLADKSKVKGTRPADNNASKAGLQVSPQAVSHTLRSAVSVRADGLKTTQPGNFKVLNRERNGLSPTGNDGQSPLNVGRIPTTPSGIPPAAIKPVNGLINPKLKVDGRVQYLTQFGEKKPVSQAQNRNDFFNSLRKKTSASQQATADQYSSCTDSSSNSQSLGGQVGNNSASIEEKPSSITTSKFLAENGNCPIVGCDVPEEPVKLATDEEEAAFLRSLGWEENAGEEALTREEIESFLSEVYIHADFSFNKFLFFIKYDHFL